MAASCPTSSSSSSNAQPSDDRTPVVLEDQVFERLIDELDAVTWPGSNADRTEDDRLRSLKELDAREPLCRVLLQDPGIAEDPFDASRDWAEFQCVHPLAMAAYYGRVKLVRYMVEVMGAPRESWFMAARDALMTFGHRHDETRTEQEQRGRVEAFAYLFDKTGRSLRCLQYMGWATEAPMIEWLRQNLSPWEGLLATAQMDLIDCIDAIEEDRWLKRLSKTSDGRNWLLDRGYDVHCDKMVLMQE